MKEKNLSYLMSGKVLILGLLDFWSLTSAHGLWEETSNPKGPVSYLEPSPILTIICVKFLHTNNKNKKP
jgi:hypothetical protein